MLLQIHTCPPSSSADTSLLPGNNQESLVRIFEDALALVDPGQTLLALENGIDVVDDLLLVLRGKDGDVALAAGTVDDNVTRAVEDVVPDVLLLRLEVGLVGRRRERSAPETEAELRRSLLVLLNTVAELSDPRCTVPEYTVLIEHRSDDDER